MEEVRFQLALYQTVTIQGINLAALRFQLGRTDVTGLLTIRIAPDNVNINGVVVKP